MLHQLLLLLCLALLASHLIGIVLLARRLALADRRSLGYGLPRSAFLRELEIGTRETEMSFAVHNRALGMYYNAHDLGGLFCQKRNLASPAFWRMLAEIRRFYRECPALLASAEAPAPEPVAAPVTTRRTLVFAPGG